MARTFDEVCFKKNPVDISVVIVIKVKLPL
jgi:hypothetical protein